MPSLVLGTEGSACLFPNIPETVNFSHVEDASHWPQSIESTPLQESSFCVLCSTATTHDDVIFFWTSPIAWNKRYSQSDVISDFRSTWMCLTGSIALQCGLSGGKLKICHYFSAASHHGKVLSPAMRRWGPIPRLCGDEADVAGATKSIVTHLLVMSKIFSGSSISSKWSK